MKTEVKESSLLKNELGLFAKTTIKRGETICRITGKVVNVNSDKYNEGWGVYLNKDNFALDTFNSNCHGKYANDACGLLKSKLKNNSKIEIINGKVYLIAITNIKKGNEIFTSYGGEYWQNFQRKPKK